MLPLKTDLDVNILPIKNKNVATVCTPDELVFFFRHCFAPNEKKFKMIFLVQLGCDCRVSEACAINISDFHKGTEFRALDMLINKKVKTYTKEGKPRRVGQNVMVTKKIPESIAAHLRAWIHDNKEKIKYYDGFIFPPNHMEKQTPYCNPLSVTHWMASKRKQLIRHFPDKGFDRIIGWKIYEEEHRLIKTQKVPRYLWSSHMMKRFAGTYTYLLTHDAVFVQQLLCHERLETTQKFYIDAASVLGNNKEEKVKNTLFDKDFYDSITNEEDNIAAVWEEKPLKPIK